jgi:2-polyprenyl-3-methyl-5-hydroxy-6-metoxy-1,4-benzoquinol methylase
MFVQEVRRTAMAALQAVSNDTPMRVETEIGSTTPAADEHEVERFAERVLGDLAATMVTSFCAIGDRLGLFRALSKAPATSAELATRAALEERYVREWASGLAAAGYLDYDPASRRFSLSAAHATVLADERSPAFMGAAHHITRELLRMLDPVEQAFRRGGGVALDAYGEDFWIATARLTGVGFEHQLLQEWIPAVPGLEARLRAGARVADVGCGAGVAVLRLAQAFPRARLDGFDLRPADLERARRAAQEAGVADRVAFHQLDAVGGLPVGPGSYDVVTCFDVVHDSRDPLGLLRAALAALRPDGVCLILEINCHEDLAANRGPAAAVLYGFSLLHCMTQSLAAGGPGLGTCGLPEPRLRALCLEAGFRTLTRAVEGPLDVLYAARP